MPDRRSFLFTLAASAAGLALKGCVPRGASEGTAATGSPYSRLGIQLYTLRAAMARDLEGTLARVAQIGYREVEFAGYFDRSPQQVRQMLDRNGLTAPSAHIPIELMTDRLTEALDAASVIGHRYLVLPWLAPDRRRTLENYREVARILDRAGQTARSRGVQVAYHNHEFEFAPIDGQVPFDLLLAETNPEHVSFQLDLYWAVNAGRDPVTYFDRYPTRFSLVHVKDSAGPPDHRQTDVGAGVIDFRRVLARAEQVGVRHFFVEHDNPPEPFEFARTSYEHLRALGG